MSFDPSQPRDKTGRWISTASIKNYEKLQTKEISHFTKSGAANENKYKGLNSEQKEIVESFVSLNDGRWVNEISAIYNNGGTTQDVKNYISEKGYNENRLNQFLHIDNYMNLKPAYNGEITRLIRDDREIFNKFGIGEEMNFDRLTSFGKAGNEFKIKGGNLRIHIEKNTRGKDISNLMPFKEEQEVLINGGKYKIIDKKEGSINHIYLQEVEE